MYYIDKNNVKVEWSDGNNFFGDLKTRHDTLTYMKADTKVGNFISPNEFFKMAHSEMPTPKNEGSSDRNTPGEFNTFKSYAEAWEVFSERPGSLDEKNRLDALLSAKEETGQTIEYGVTGDFLDMGLFMEGDPECFGSLTYGHPRRFRMDITIDLNAVWSVDQKQINKKLQRIIRLVDWAASNNIAMKISALASTECAHLELGIKSYDERLNINNLIVTSHSEFLRRFMFRFDEYSKTWQYGYGSAFSFSDTAIKTSREGIETMYISIYNHRDMSDSNITKQFDKLEADIQEHVSNPTKPFVERHVLNNNG